MPHAVLFQIIFQFKSSYLLDSIAITSVAPLDIFTFLLDAYVMTLISTFFAGLLHFILLSNLFAQIIHFLLTKQIVNDKVLDKIRKIFGIKLQIWIFE